MRPFTQCQHNSTIAPTRTHLVTNLVLGEIKGVSKVQDTLPILCTLGSGDGGDKEGAEGQGKR